MPLIKNAKPGSKGFKQNIETEIHMGNKAPKQAVAIAYDEYRKTRSERTHGKHGRG
jgi:hypothetical protein